MDLNRAIEFIEQRGRFALVLPERPTFDCLAAAEVMTNYLETRRKQTGLLTQAAQESSEQKAFPRLISLPPLPRELIVSLDAVAAPVSQLRYEKQEDRIDIILSPASSELLEEHISFRKGRIFCDAIIALGVEDIERINFSQGFDPEFILKSPILNIDTSPGNKNYGEINLINDGGALSETVYKLLSLSNGQTLSAENATLLLAGILSYNEGFMSARPSPDSLLSASELIRLGAEWERSQKLWKNSTPLSLIQLFGRAAVRSKTDADQNVMWTFLTSDDFEKTKRTPEDTSYVLDYFRRHMPPHKITSLLWQNSEDKSVRAVLAGANQALNLVSSKESGEFRSPHFALDRNFASFAEAEEYVASLLKGVL